MLLCEAGKRPELLQFRNLKHSHRRLLAITELMRELSDNPDLSHAYEAAKQLMVAGDMPDLRHSRLKHLAELCEEAATGIGAQIDNLSARAKRRIDAALGSDPLKQGCLAPDDRDARKDCPGKEKPRWVTRRGAALESGAPLDKTVCAYCKVAAAYGRSTLSRTQCQLGPVLGYFPAQDDPDDLARAAKRARYR